MNKQISTKTSKQVISDPSEFRNYEALLHEHDDAQFSLKGK